MDRTVSARLSEWEIEALDALAKQKGVSRSQLLASIAKQAVNAEARQAVNEAIHDVDSEDALEAVHHVYVALPFPFTCPECGETSRCATLCPICGKLELHGCREDCPRIIEGWLLSEMYPIKVG